MKLIHDFPVGFSLKWLEKVEFFHINYNRKLCMGHKWQKPQKFMIFESFGQNAVDIMKDYYYGNNSWKKSHSNNIGVTAKKENEENLSLILGK